MRQLQRNRTLWQLPLARVGHKSLGSNAVGPHNELGPLDAGPPPSAP